MNKKQNIVERAMRYRQIVILITALWVAFGIFALGKMNKNEFPDFTVRQGVVAAVYPGASVNDVEQMIIFSSPGGNVVRVKDIATVHREYTAPASFVTNNGKKCIVLSIEMKKGRNITETGSEVKQQLSEFQKTLPSDVSMFTITDQSKVVGYSVTNFLKELLIAIIAVVVVVVLLLPLRVALVAAGTIPVSIFISLGLFYAFGIELNTVTLAALIVTLGMIVDNSIVIIDNYMELLAGGMSRWNASIKSTNHFFKSILSATLAISLTFFPLLASLSLIAPGTAMGRTAARQRVLVNVLSRRHIAYGYSYPQRHHHVRLC